MDTDPRPMSLPAGDRLTHEDAQARELADAYVAGRLDAAASAAFEDHYFECAACWEEIEDLRRLRAGIRDARLRESPPASPWRWAFAAAAAALIALASWTFGIRIPQLESDLAAARRVPPPVLLAQANLPVLQLEASRAGEAPVVTLPDSGQVALWLDAPPPGAGPFVLEVTGPQEKLVETFTGLTPNALDALTAALPAGKLPPGTYIARLKRADGTLAAEYRFQTRL